MEFLLPLAAKSLLIAGATLLLLKAMQRRSAADRSLVAHLGLASILILPLALLALPQMEIETALLGAKDPVIAPVPVEQAPLGTAKEVAPATATFPEPAEPSILTGVDWAFWAYAAPAALLLLLTLTALGRLVLLKAKANVLVEPRWLTALAHAQRRMGFKHGTALLTSDELRSPISWGLMRPVILLNSEAADAHEEAEAIIAHELAHVARLDWVKLLLSRVTVALFWFNPLVWLLAREAHQLREEAADDSVLASNIDDTDYARLLVGIARHECRGLLLGAHGVAPAKNSLARRVQRVLDSALARAPGGWRWTAAAGFFAAGMAVPMAVLQFVPTTPVSAAHVDSVGGKAAPRIAEAVEPIGAGDAAPMETAASNASESAREAAATARSIMTHDGGTIDVRGSKTVMRSPDGRTITIYPPDASGRRKTVMHGPAGTISTFADARAIPGLAAATAIAAHPHDDAIDRAVAFKAVGVTREYIAAMRAASPRLRAVDADEFVGMKAVGVTPDYVRAMTAAGMDNAGPEELTGARAVGVTPDYVRALAAAGYRGSLEDYVAMRAVGVTPADVAQFRRSGRQPTAEQLIKLKAMGIEVGEIDLDPDP